MPQEILSIFSLQFSGHEELPAFEEEINTFLLQKLTITQRAVTCNSGLSIYLFHQETADECQEKVKIFYSCNGTDKLVTDYNKWTKAHSEFNITDRRTAFWEGYSYLIVFYK